MPQPATINPRIIEGLYGEAVVLSDEVRAAFDFASRIDDVERYVIQHDVGQQGGGQQDRAQQDETGDGDAARVALSCEALRTTTRMMHALAWLLNHRAFLAGEISEFQLRRHGRLAADVPTADTARLALLTPEIRKLISTTERFYARLLRVDRGWRERQVSEPSAIDRLRRRLGDRVGV